jgi:hypothetical protein
MHVLNLHSFFALQLPCDGAGQLVGAAMLSQSRVQQ